MCIDGNVAAPAARHWTGKVPCFNLPAKLLFMCVIPLWLRNFIDLLYFIVLRNSRCLCVKSVGLRISNSFALYCTTRLENVVDEIWCDAPIEALPCCIPYRLGVSQCTVSPSGLGAPCRLCATSPVSKLFKCQSAVLAAKIFSSLERWADIGANASSKARGCGMRGGGFWGGAAGGSVGRCNRYLIQCNTSPLYCYQAEGKIGLLSISSASSLGQSHEQCHNILHRVRHCLFKLLKSEFL